MALSRKEVTALFGGIYWERTGDAPRWMLECKFMVLAHVPDGYDHLINTATGKPTRHIYVNSFMREPLVSALTEIRDLGLAHELKTFDGCFSVRHVRGGNDWSWHSFGMAIDFNAASNQLGTSGDMHPEVVRVFLKHGFAWGGHFRSRLDTMHFQFVCD